MHRLTFTPVAIVLEVTLANLQRFTEAGLWSKQNVVCILLLFREHIDKDFKKGTFCCFALCVVVVVFPHTCRHSAGLHCIGILHTPKLKPNPKVYPALMQ